jgi:hypothetical protein
VEKEAYYSGKRECVGETEVGKGRRGGKVGVQAVALRKGAGGPA